MAVLKGPLRNQFGRAAYEVFVWGPLPWAIGAFFLLLASLLGDKLKQLLGFAFGRVFRSWRPKPGEPGPGGAGPQHAG